MSSKTHSPAHTPVHSLEGHLVDPVADRIHPVRLRMENGRIVERQSLQRSSGPYLLPGLVDAHVHVESSMLPPSSFARLAVRHGTVGTVSDPHEIANVLGADGVHWMIRDGLRVPFKFCFGAPSCVPATAFETAGGKLPAAAVAELLAHPHIGYLAEVMNYPGVLNRDPELMAMIEAAQREGKPVDGHAPGLRGADALRYAAAGIQTDHECFTLEEALDKLEAGMWVLIREGSAAKNFEALHPLLSSHPDRVMFCSDDKHPDDLLSGHINTLLARSVAKGHPVMAALRAATVHPVQHYRLSAGLLQEGDAADLCTVDDLVAFRVQQTWIDGQLAFNREKAVPGAASASPPTAVRTSIPAADEGCPWPVLALDQPNAFGLQTPEARLATDAVPAAWDPCKPEAYALPREGESVQVIHAQDGQLVTDSFWTDAPAGDPVPTSIEEDLLYIAVVNRYQDAAKGGRKPAMALIKGFGLREGALASTVAHDSHNIVAVGCDAESLARVVHLLVAEQGGIAVCSEPKKGEGGAMERQEAVLPLPIAGLMSDREGPWVARAYERLDSQAKAQGSTLKAPFMTLAFMALLVIPSLKISDQGLFDGNAFAFTPLFR
jgi:adenine deaminase